MNGSWLTSIDFPAPLSPVTTFKPAVNVMCCSWMRAKSRMWRSRKCVPLLAKVSRGSEPAACGESAWSDATCACSTLWPRGPEPSVWKVPLPVQQEEIWHKTEAESVDWDLGEGSDGDGRMLFMKHYQGAQLADFWCCWGQVLLANEGCLWYHGNSISGPCVIHQFCSFHAIYISIQAHRFAHPM